MCAEFFPDFLKCVENTDKIIKVYEKSVASLH